MSDKSTKIPRADGPGGGGGGRGEGGLNIWEMGLVSSTK